jgi:hypothetical protein
MEKKMKGTALVTGANRGLGLEVCRQRKEPRSSMSGAPPRLPPHGLDAP